MLKLIRKNLVKPKNNNQKNSSNFQVLGRIISQYVKPYKWRVMLALFFMIITAICTTLIVNQVQPAIDKLFITRDREMLFILPIITLTTFIVKGWAEFAHSFIIKYLGQKILTDLQLDMYKKLLYEDFGFIRQQSSGKLISRFTNDITMMRAAVSNLLVNSAKHLLSVLFLIALMFRLDYILSLFVFIIFPVAIFPIQQIGKKIRTLSNNVQEELSYFTSKLDETFKSIKIVKSFCGEKIEIKRGEKIALNILSFYRNAAKFDAMVPPVMEFLSGLVVAGIIFYGGLRVINGTSTPGTIFAFITAFVSAYRPFKSLVSMNVSLQEGIVAARRVFAILDRKPEIFDIKNHTKLDTESLDITFDNVALQYDRLKPVLSGFSMQIKNGTHIGLIGKSGEGKSSIINLLIRLYDPDSGSILINGNTIKNYSLSSLRHHISLVTQDTILFDDTIAANISYNNSSATKKDIEFVAKLVGAHEFISHLPGGYNYNIGDSGSSLSGGQKQRIAIARSMLKNAPILIMDEATSALDMDSEHKILSNIREYRKGKTTIIITHRVSTIVNLDQLVIIKQGQIIAKGSHDELIKQENKEYAKLLHMVERNKH